MSKNPETVVEDIYKSIQDVIDGKSKELDSDRLITLGAHVSLAVEKSFTARNKPREEKVLYMSEVGKPCSRQLWYDLKGYDREPLRPENLIKFLYGDILEALVLALVEFAGHEVSHEQQSCIIELRNGWQVRGRMDAKIDGEVCDVKSASSYAFDKKFAKNEVHLDDAFGYMGQLQGYVHTGRGEDEEYAEKASFLAIDKTLGKLARAEYEFDDTDRDEFLSNLNKLTEALEKDTPPDRAFEEKAIGKSGNMGLGVGCSYCSHKQECWKDANKGKGLRTFIYSNGPTYLTDVKRVPAVTEVMRDGSTLTPEKKK